MSFTDAQGGHRVVVGASHNQGTHQLNMELGAQGMAQEKDVRTHGFASTYRGLEFKAQPFKQCTEY